MTFNLFVRSKRDTGHYTKTLQVFMFFWQINVEIDEIYGTVL
jgi:hypothetical protein